jgi:streptothricin acetyltransferase
MSLPFEIRALHPFTQAEIWPIISGYETQEIYAVEKRETDLHTLIDIRLVRLGTPYRASFEQDFTPEDCAWYRRLVEKGCCFGAYQQERLIGFAIGEIIPEDHLLRVWEFHVMSEFRRRGVGRALMQRVIAQARGERLPTILLETQNTNVKAVRFYRSMGFALESLDLSPPHYQKLGGQEASEVAFYMKLQSGKEQG